MLLASHTSHIGNCLRQLGMYSMKGRLIRQDLIQVWKITHGCSPMLEHLFRVQDHTYTRGHEFKIFIPRVHSDIHSRFFSIRAIEIWNSLPANVVAAQSIQAFKSRLHSAIENLLYDYV